MMAQVLTVCRIGTGWGFRDVTGAEYAHSADIDFVVEAAQRMAQKIGGNVAFSTEAEQHYRDYSWAGQQVDSPPRSRLNFRGLLARLAWWRTK
jgi:hypothetical protein